jgi:hypothetical protein
LPVWYAIPEGSDSFSIAFTAAPEPLRGGLTAEQFAETMMNGLVAAF